MSEKVVFLRQEKLEDFATHIGCAIDMRRPSFVLTVRWTTLFALNSNNKARIVPASEKQGKARKKRRN